MIDSPAVALRGGFDWTRPLGWLALFFGLLPLLIMMVGGGVFGGAKPSWWSWFPQTSFLMALVLGFGALQARRARAGKTGRLTSSAGSVTATAGSETVTLDRAALESGSVAPDAKGATVVLTGEQGSISASVPSTEDGELFLSQLGLDPARRRLDTTFRTGIRRVAFGILLVFALFLFAGFLARAPGQMPAGIGFAWLAAAIPAFAAFFLGTKPPTVSVGSDGIRIGRALRGTFLPFSEIVAVRKENDTLVLERKGGIPEVVRVPEGNGVTLEALVWRVRLGIAAHSEGATSPARLALLERGGRSLSEWRARLSNVTADSGYRNVPLSGADLEAILVEPGAAAEHRLGAAMALREKVEDAPRKIRVAAEQCASPRLRVALEAVAADENQDAELEEALRAEEEAVESEARPPL